MYYAGIGSRETPGVILEQMEEVAYLLMSAGHCLRSGGADGADSAFEAGAMDVNEIWVPWEGFNGSDSVLIPSDFHFDIASLYHPKWNSLRGSVKKLHARNVGQILGHDGSIPSKFVLCWTPDGCSNGLMTTKETGGTGQAIRIATGYGVPVINMQTMFWKEELADCLTSSSKSI